jgi:SEC-C motif-containing protein
MRSRYSAFALRNSGYLLATWHGSTRPATLSLEPGSELTWTRLEIHAVKRGGPFDSEGTVEFTAHSRAGNERYRQHEVSRFVRADKTWFYLDAQP